MIFITLPRADASPLPPTHQLLGSEVDPPHSHAKRRLRRPSTKVEQNASAGPSCSAASTPTSREPSAAASSMHTSNRSTPDIVVPSSAVPSNATKRDLARVWEAVSDSRRIIVVCGAGISVSQPAGIPDFRSSTGLFKSLKEQHPEAGLTSGKDLFDARLFQSEANTALFYSMIASLHKMTVSAQPTLFHHFLRRLDEQGRLQRVYTQNIDALEERAGLTFGLGEGAGRLFKRTASLGKRKRTAGAAPPETAQMTLPAARRRATWSKSQSAPSVSLAPPPSLFGPSPEPTTAMFPRVIPLHGSLANLVCTACDHKMSTLPEPTPDVASAIQSLAEGEPPQCPACSERDAVRLAAGLRSRGIGFLKPDVVLYNGDNKSGERVGECLERDVLGLRDRLDGRVPETHAERNHRKKRADKEAEKERSATVAEVEEEANHSIMSIESVLQVEDALGKVFEEDDEDDEEGAEGVMADSLAKCSVSCLKPRSRKSFQRAVTQPTPTAMLKQVSKSSSEGGGTTSGANPSGRNVRLKPLPPDLLIVAGTSLKVPGTKRIVREFAKAARARDGIIPKGCKSRLNASNAEARDGSKTPSLRSRSRTSPEGDDSGGSEDEEGSDEEGAKEDGSNPHRPIRTILLNYDFPVPSKEWEGIFDVWIQGDVQASAGGLWKASKGYGMGPSLDAGDETDEDEKDETDSVIEGCQSWHIGIDELDEAREMIPKPGKVFKSRQAVSANGEDTMESGISAPSSPKKNRSASTGGQRKGSTSARSTAAATTATSSRLRALKEEPGSLGEDTDMTESSIDYSAGSSPIVKVLGGQITPSSPSREDSKSEMMIKSKAKGAPVGLKRTPSSASSSKKVQQVQSSNELVDSIAKQGRSSVQQASRQQNHVDKSFKAVKGRNSLPASSSTTVTTTTSKTKNGLGSTASTTYKDKEGQTGTKLERKSSSVGRAKKVNGV